MAAVSKNVYFDVLDGIVDNYNNTFHRTIKMKSTQQADIAPQDLPWTPPSNVP